MFWGSRFIVLAVGALLLTGCSTVNTIKQEYKTINLKNGVTARQAEVVAQNQLLQLGKDKAYSVFTAKILETPASRQYPDYWFVDFTSTDYFNRSFWAYLIVVSKKDGSIKYTGEYVPLAIADFEYIFNPQAK